MVKKERINYATDGGSFEKWFPDIDTNQERIVIYINISLGFGPVWDRK